MCYPSSPLSYFHLLSKQHLLLPIIALGIKSTQYACMPAPNGSSTIGRLPLIACLLVQYSRPGQHLTISPAISSPHDNMLHCYSDLSNHHAFIPPQHPSTHSFMHYIQSSIHSPNLSKLQPMRTCILTSSCNCSCHSSRDYPSIASNHRIRYTLHVLSAR